MLAAFILLASTILISNPTAALSMDEQLRMINKIKLVEAGDRFHAANFTQTELRHEFVQKLGQDLVHHFINSSKLACSGKKPSRPPPLILSELKTATDNLEVYIKGRERAINFGVKSIEVGALIGIAVAGAITLMNMVLVPLVWHKLNPRREFRLFSRG